MQAITEQALQALKQLSSDIERLDDALADSPRGSVWRPPPRRMQAWVVSTEVITRPSAAWQALCSFAREEPQAAGWIEGTSAVRVDHPARTGPLPDSAAAAGVGRVLNAEIGSRARTLSVRHLGSEWLCAVTVAVDLPASGEADLQPVSPDSADISAGSTCEAGLVEPARHLCSHDGAAAVRYDVLHRLGEDGLTRSSARVTGVDDFGQ